MGPHPWLLGHQDRQFNSLSDFCFKLVETTTSEIINNTSKSEQQ